MSESSDNQKPKKLGQLPVTQDMYDDLRAEIKSDITTLSLSMKAQFSTVNAKFPAIDARFEQVDARFDELHSEIKSMRSEVMSAIHRMTAMYDEQFRNNKVALDGYMSVYEKQEKIETEIAEIKETLSSF